MPSAIKLVDPAQNEFLASLEAKAKHPNPFFRAMANRPEALKSFVPFYGAVVGPGSVERRIKVLVYLVTSYANQCAFCIAANLPSGKKVGLTDEQLSAIQNQRDDGFSDAERAAIHYARELTRHARADAARDALLQFFNDEQIVEITLVVAMANFTNRFNNGLAILPEA
jgi:uncharacterized peroxidase-related enzyme